MTCINTYENNIVLVTYKDYFIFLTLLKGFKELDSHSWLFLCQDSERMPLKPLSTTLVADKSQSTLLFTLMWKVSIMKRHWQKTTNKAIGDPIQILTIFGSIFHIILKLLLIPQLENSWNKIQDTKRNYVSFHKQTWKPSKTKF